jgi:hypothetical protein
MKRQFRTNQVCMNAKAVSPVSVQRHIGPRAKRRKVIPLVRHQQAKLRLITAYSKNITAHPRRQDVSFLPKEGRQERVHRDKPKLKPELRNDEAGLHNCRPASNGCWRKRNG